MKLKVFVSTTPFGEYCSDSLEVLHRNGFEVFLNPYGRKITSTELADCVKDADILIAGTEKITEEVFRNAPKLKLIARVGIGLDGVDFDLCEKYGVRVTYTPEAPTLAVAELTLGFMIDLLRLTYQVNEKMHKGLWTRKMGCLLYGKTVGLVGLGRIGKSVSHLLSGFNVKILACEIKPDYAFIRSNSIELVSKQEILERSDILSLHIPLKSDTVNYITEKELKSMKKSSCLINTARGGVVNESDLAKALRNGIISSAAVDVYENEPYNEELCTLENAVLTCHMGACTQESRCQMEGEAVQEVLRFSSGQSLVNEVFANA
jgi:D-3-phosphoglycerate dehydrogenase